MFNKSLAAIVSAAVIVAGPGHLALTAAAQTKSRGSVTRVSEVPLLAVSNIPMLGTAPLLAVSNIPMLGTAPSLVVTNIPMLGAAPSLVVTNIPMLGAAPSLVVTNIPILGAAPSLSVIKSEDARVGAIEKRDALGSLFDNSIITGHEPIDVLGRSAASLESRLSRSNAASAKPPAAAGGRLWTAAGAEVRQRGVADPGLLAASIVFGGVSFLLAATTTIGIGVFAAGIGVMAILIGEYAGARKSLNSAPIVALNILPSAGDAVQGWVKRKVEAVFKTGDWNSSIDSSLASVASEEGLTQADIKFVARSAGYVLDSGYWDNSMTHQALARRQDLTLQSAQYVLDSVARSARWKSTVMGVQKIILNNKACRPFLEQLRIYY